MVEEGTNGEKRRGIQDPFFGDSVQIITDKG